MPRSRPSKANRRKKASKSQKAAKKKKKELNNIENSKPDKLNGKSSTLQCTQRADTDLIQSQGQSNDNRNFTLSNTSLEITGQVQGGVSNNDINTTDEPDLQVERNGKRSYGKTPSIFFEDYDSSEDENEEEENEDAVEEYVGETRKGRISANGIVELQWTCNQLLKEQRKHNDECPGQLYLYDNTCTVFTNRLEIHCKSCDAKIYCKTTSPNKQQDLVDAFYVGTVSSGSTFAHTAELLAVLNVKPCSYGGFAAAAQRTENALEEITKESLEDAIRLEKCIAIGKAEIDSESIPCISVIIDGSWNKRSFGHGHSASSGSLAIIGAETGKVLWVGTKNTRCKACDYGNLTHRCYANWNKAPGGMEAALAVQAINELYIVYGLKCKVIISDEDSSVYRTIKEEVVFGNEIEKIACTNHIRKNFKKKLLKNESNTSFTSISRKIMSNMREKILYRLNWLLLNSEKHPEIDVSQFIVDIQNIAEHIFDDHQKCKLDTCKDAGQDKSTATYQEIVNTPIFASLKETLRDLSLKANRIRHNKNTNAAESFFGSQNKFNLGKRIDLASRGEFQRRVIATAANWNDEHWVLKWLKKAIGSDSGVFLKQFMERKSDKRNYDKNREKPQKKKKSLPITEHTEKTPTTL